LGDWTPLYEYKMLAACRAQMDSLKAGGFADRLRCLAMGTVRL
jgi:hypothetical protein